MLRKKTEYRKYLRENENVLENILTCESWDQVLLIHEKNQRSKISCYSPFKPIWIIGYKFVYVNRDDFVTQYIVRLRIKLFHYFNILINFFSILRDCLTKKNRGQKWYQSIGLPLSFYHKKFHSFLFSCDLVFYLKLLSII